MPMLLRRLMIASLSVFLLSQNGRAAELTIVGAWTLNKDLTPMPDGPPRRPEGGGERRRPEGGGGGRGGYGGGGRGGGFGRGGGGKEPDELEMHKMQAVRDRLTDIPERLTITRTETSVTIADALGRTATLKTDNKKQPRLTGEGEFTSKAHYEGAKLIVEDDFSGPKVITTYEPLLDRGEIRQLKVTVSVENMPRGGGRGPGGPPPGAGGGGGERREPPQGAPPQEGRDGARGPGGPGRGVVRIYDAADQK